MAVISKPRCRACLFRGGRDHFVGLVARPYDGVTGTRREGATSARRRAVCAAAAVVTLMMAAGCASGDRGGARVPPVAGKTDSRVPSRLSPGSLTIPSGRPRMLTLGQLGGLTSMPWRLTSITDGGRTLGLIYVTGDGDCTRPRGVYVSETASSVLLEVLSKTESNRNACAGMLTMARGAVRLDAPLGGRALVHAVVSDAWTNPNFFRGVTSP